MTKIFSKINFTTIIIFCVFISIGLPDGFFGVAWPTISADLGIRLEYAWLTSISFTFSYATSSYFSHYIIRKMKFGDIVAFSCFLTCLALFGYANAQTLTHLLIFSLVLGLGSGCIDVSLNNYVAKHYTSKHMNWLHGFWGIGATLGPLIMTLVFFLGSSWRYGYIIVSLIQLSLTIILLINRNIWVDGNDVTLQKKEQGKRSVLSMSDYHRVLFFFISCGIEISIGLWSGSYLVSIRGLPNEIIGIWVSCFFGFMMVGRFIIGFISNRLGNRKIITIGIIITIFGGLLMNIDNNLVSIVAFALLGFGQSSLYPSMMHDTNNIYNEKISEKFISLQVTAAILGGLFFTALIGIIISAIGLEYIFVLILFMILAEFASFSYYCYFLRKLPVTDYK